MNVNMVFVNIRSACLYAGSEVSGGGDERRDLSASNLGGRREGGGFMIISIYRTVKQNYGRFVPQCNNETAQLHTTYERSHSCKKSDSLCQVVAYR